ncbi:2,4-dihydroxyhept-2-ene-1,7-dioic acid aldolase [candidate division KSB1 bacterium]|nr:2,4-dihydroxyhept-2-ene-1,7-dioic acid aldolase [candidate division KSB1 bacterium]
MTKDTIGFRQRLKRGDVLLGTLMSFNFAEVAELLAKAGFDWLFIDAEHGTCDVRDLQAMLQAADPYTECVIRIPALDEGMIKRALDIGASGLIIPQVNTATIAENAVRWGRYPPEGSRGLGLARAQGYGFEWQSYVAHANERIALIVQAESAEAVRNIIDIVTVPGIDAVLIGPYDLSASLGLPGELMHADVVGAIEKITRACRAKRMPLGIFGLTAEAVKPYLERGFQLIVAGVDATLLGYAARELVRELQN